MGQLKEWVLMVLYIVFVLTVAFASITLAQQYIIPWPLENLGLLGALFSILSLLFALSLRRFSKWYRTHTLIMLTAAVLGFSFLHVEFVKSGTYKNDPFRYITGWSITKAGKRNIEFCKYLPNPDICPGPEQLPENYTYFSTIGWLYMLAYLLGLSSLVFFLGTMMPTQQTEPSTAEVLVIQGPEENVQPALTSTDEEENEVFISYAWERDSEIIAGEIEQAFKDKAVTIVRDKNYMGFKDKIQEFMERVGRGKCVILVISNEYLTSRNCMFELLEVEKHGDFEERVFPVVLPNALIHKREDRRRYEQFWEKETEDLQAHIGTVPPANIATTIADLKLHGEICTSLPRLLQIIKNMNTLTLDVHRASNYRDLVDKVTAKLATE